MGLGPLEDRVELERQAAVERRLRIHEASAPFVEIVRIGHVDAVQRAAAAAARAPADVVAPAVVEGEDVKLLRLVEVERRPDHVGVEAPRAVGRRAFDDDAVEPEDGAVRAKHVLAAEAEVERLDADGGQPRGLEPLRVEVEVVEEHLVREVVGTPFLRVVRRREVAELVRDPRIEAERARLDLEPRARAKAHLVAVFGAFGGRHRIGAAARQAGQVVHDLLAKAEVGAGVKPDRVLPPGRGFVRRFGDCRQRRAGGEGEYRRLHRIASTHAHYSLLRWILPEIVLGSSSRKTTMRGYL